MLKPPHYQIFTTEVFQKYSTISSAGKKSADMNHEIYDKTRHVPSIEKYRTFYNYYNISCFNISGNYRTFAENVFVEK